MFHSLSLVLFSVSIRVPCRPTHRDERECLFQSHSQCFIPIPDPRFSLVLFPFPLIIPIGYSHSLPSPFPFRLTYSAMSLRSCCCSSSGSQRSLKSKTRRFVAGGLWQSIVSRTVRRSSQRSWCSTTDGLLLFLWLEVGKRGVFIPSHSHQAIPIPIPIKLA